jgi:hypothetical protein
MEEDDMSEQVSEEVNATNDGEAKNLPKKHYTCIHCDKQYAMYSSFWSHNKRVHGATNAVKTTECYPQNDEKTNCTVCNKEFKHKSSMYRHQKQCAAAKKARDDLERDHAKMLEEHRIKQQTFKIEKDKIIHEQKLVSLQIKMQKAKNVARTKTITVRQLNQMLKALSEKIAVRNQIMNNSMNQNNTNSLNNINSNNRYNIQILQLGSEQVLRSLSMEDKKAIIDKRMCSLEKIVELVHCGVQNMFKNIIITNLKDRFCYRYDKAQGQFVTATKEDVLEDLVANRIMDLEAIYDEFATASKIDEKTKQLIQTFLEKLEETDVRFTDDAAVYSSYRDFKKHRIKILLYDNHDKISKDIALLIGDRISSLEDDPFAFAIEAATTKSNTTKNTIIESQGGQGPTVPHRDLRSPNTTNN